MKAKSSLFRAYEQAGFTLVRMTNHAVWRCPCGHCKITTPTSPGRGRSGTNSMVLLARTLRACTARTEGKAA